ncbi:hypothetical protein UFOVP670_53 [uncultured Caudovirales phage]|uniref:Uncharacterized protein n=1 Tax=uncultured Caudovirales phage TaxID=2100421 RepID=A0A6J5NBR4_9CAUD|nr:hypothetical protein UFOVP670_53 [uncultured Caudovirales phage]
MITEFPALVYRCPGPHAGPHGKTYDARPVASPEALAEALRDGWHWSLDDAARGLVAQPEPAPEVLAEVVPEPAPDTRANLVAEAERLGVDVDGRWSERRLRQEIDAAKAASL